MNVVNHETAYTDPRLAFAVEETSNENEIRQKFDASSSGLQVIHGRDLSGEIAIVTGASSGIGNELTFEYNMEGVVAKWCNCW